MTGKNVKQNEKAEALIKALTPEIERKCALIQEERQQRKMASLFILLSLMAIIVPTLLVFCGLSLVPLTIAFVFLAASTLLLSPILFHQQGGRTYEQA